MEGRCGKCGIKNEGGKLNPYPWFVAIKETLIDQDVYHTGTLVSKEWVLTAASIFVGKNFDALRKNFKALVGTRAFEAHINPSISNDWIPISEILTHPKYSSDIKYQFDIAMLKLKTQVKDPLPLPTADPIRPVCQPHLTQSLDIPVDEEAWNSRLLAVKEARIMRYQECKQWNSNILEQEPIGLTLQP